MQSYHKSACWHILCLFTICSNSKPRVRETNSMKKLLLIAGIVVSTSVLADQVRTVDNYGPYQTGSGGEFTLQVMDNSLSPDLNPYLAHYASVALNQYSGSIPSSPTTPNFQTFCVEGSEFIYPNTVFDVSLGQVTQFGGGSPTSLTVGAAYLYYAFAKGLFNGVGISPNYNYANVFSGSFPNGRDTSAGQLQNAIWWLMGQEGQVYNAANPYEYLVQNHIASPFALNSSLANPISVSVLSLWATTPDDVSHIGDPNYARQDQLILTGDQGFNLVPDGGLTVAMLGMAFSTLAYFNRKQRA